MKTILVVIALAFAACAHHALALVIGNNATLSPDASSDGAATRMATCENAGDVFEDCH